MKTLSYILSTLIISFCITLNGYSQELTAAQQSAIATEVDALFDKTIEAAETLDSSILAGSVDDSLKAGFIVTGRYFRDFAPVIAEFDVNKVGCKYQKMDVVNKKITVLSDNAALITASGNYTLALEDGRNLTGTFAYTLVYSRVNGEWKIIHTHM